MKEYPMSVLFYVVLFIATCSFGLLTKGNRN
ncbi:hypothetical protein HNQ60_004500 [Povalibacter uvarum]|uniref:Uncharacterized protein n=1 Tax=Povalibacter uvarum TaxID=732238 RepID=A0A841HTS3_9GAMM|nr:hypothetical protein [Povalibacter uvarum]